MEMPEHLAFLCSKSINNLSQYSQLLKTMHYIGKLVCILVLTYTAYASLQKGPLKIQLQPPPVPFFLQNSTVPDFYHGDIVQPFSNIIQSDISVILYYAPWDFDSQLIRTEFLKVAEQFHNEIYFAAINCWVPHGECREQFPNIRSFPMIFAYVRGYKGIQYRGPLIAAYISKFLQSILHPVQRINSLSDLLKIQSLHDAVVLGYFDFTKNIPIGYHSFYSAAVKYLELDPHRSTAFASVTNSIAAEDLKLTANVSNGWDIRLYLWNQTLIYPKLKGKIDIDRLVSWVFHRCHSPIKWLTPTGRKSSMFQSYLQDTGKPSLILFTDRLKPSPRDYLLVKEVALNYLNCKASERILKLSMAIQKQIEDVRKGKTSMQGRFNTMQCFISQQNLSFCSTVSTPRTFANTCYSGHSEEYVYSRVDSFGCKTNRTLSFYALDSNMYGFYGSKLGLSDLQTNVNNSVAVIIDPQEESTYVLQKKLSKQSIEGFIKEYTKRSLSRLRRSVSMTEARPCRFEEICVEEIFANNYEDVVLRGKSDVLILYRKPNCVFCDSAARVFLKAAHLLTNSNSLSNDSSRPKIKFVTFNGELNDVSWHLTADRYPTIVFFPAHRKSESRIFPYERELTIGNLMQFIVTQLSPQQQLALFLQSCTSMPCLREANIRKRIKLELVSAKLRKAKLRLAFLKNWPFALDRLRQNYIDTLQNDVKLLKKEREFLLQIHSSVTKRIRASDDKQKTIVMASGILGL